MVSGRAEFTGTAQISGTARIAPPASGFAEQSPVDLGPLGGSLLRNPETVDRILQGLDYQTVEQLFRLMVSSGRVAGQSAQDGWQAIRDQWLRDGAQDVVGPQLERLGDRVDDLRELLEDSLRGSESPTPSQGLSEDRAKGYAAVAMLFVAAALGGYAFGTDDPRLQFLTGLIIGLYGLFGQWWTSPGD